MASTTNQSDVDLLSRQVELMERMNGLLEQQYDRLASIQGALEGQSAMTQQAAGAINDYNNAAQGMGSSNEQIANSLEGATSSFDTFTSSIKNFIGSDAYDSITGGLSDGFKLLGINISSLSSAISNPLAAAFQVAGSLFDMLVKKAGEYLDRMYDLAQAQERIREKFGSFNENTSRRTIAAYKELGSTFRTTTANAKQFAGKFPVDPFEAAEKKIEIAIGLSEDLGATFDILGQQFNDAADDLYLLKNGLNFGSEAMKQTAVLSQLSGKSIKSFSEEIMASVDKIGKHFGISTKVLGQDVGKALSNFKMLGKMTGDYVKDITKAAVFTRKLGIELNELTGIVDKFDEFEGGAEAAAQLAQGFGMVLDPLKMMGMEAGPRLQELQRAFMATGRSIESMSRQERKLLADTAGLTEEQAALAFSSKGMSMSYDEISKGADDATKKQKAHEQIMNDMLDNVANVISKIGTFTSFFNAFIQGFGTGFGRVIGPLVRAFAVDLKEVAEAGRQVGRVVAWILFPPGAKGADSPVIKYIKDLGQMFVDISKDVEHFADAIRDGNITDGVTKFMDDIWGHISSRFSMSGGGSFISQMALKVGTTLLQIFSGAVDWLVKKIPEWTQSLNEMFVGATSGSGGGLKQAWDDAMDHLSAALPQLMQSVPDLAEALGRAIWRMLKEYKWAALMTTLFASAGPLATMFAGLKTGFFSAVGNVFGGPGAAASSVPGASTAQTQAASAAGAAMAGAATDGATAVVEGGQGILDKLFGLVEAPAKVALMAVAIASSIKTLGAAVQDVMLSFMDPLPGRDYSFIALVASTARLFDDVPMTSLLALGGVMAAVGAVIAGLAAAIGFAASKMTGAQLAMVAGGIVVGGAVSGAAGSIFSRVIGSIGSILEDIAKPFSNPMFIASLIQMSSVVTMLPSLATAAGVIKDVALAMVEIRNSLPKGMIGFGPAEVAPLAATMDGVLKLLGGNPEGATPFERQGLIKAIAQMPVATNLGAQIATISITNSVVVAIGSLAGSINGLPDLDDATDKISDLVGKHKFLHYMSALPGWINLAATPPINDAAISNIDLMARAMTTVDGVVKSLDAVGTLGFQAAKLQAASFISFMPDLTQSVNTMSTEMSKMTPMAAADAKVKADSIDAMFAGLDRYAAAMERTTTAFTITSMGEFELRVGAIVAHIVGVRKTLESIPTLALDTVLEKFGESVNVAKSAFSISGGAVQIAVQLNVTMNSEKISQALVLGGYVEGTPGYKSLLQDDDNELGRFDGITNNQQDDLARSVKNAVEDGYFGIT